MKLGGNMIDTNEESMKMLIDELGVFELRGVARQLGVPSPTTKKRDELIDLIYEAIKNGATIKDATQKRGRPYKKLNILDSITNKISNEAVKINFSNTQKVVGFAQGKTIPIDFTQLEGIITKYNYCIEMRDILSGSVVKFDKTEHLNELLETGDRVRATVDYVDGQFVFKKLLEINGVEVEKYRSKFVDKGSPVIENKEIPFADTKATLGRRNLYRLSTELFENNNVENLLDYCCEEGYELIVLAVNTAFENEIKFRSLPTINKFVTEYGASNKMSYNKILDAVNYAENLVDRGNKVVFFVADIMEAVRCLDKYFSKEEEDEEHEDATVLVTQKLLRFACAYSQGCSGTLIMCYNEVDKNDKFLFNDLFKISKKIN